VRSKEVRAKAKSLRATSRETETCGFAATDAVRLASPVAIL
jgi:hypothetical protein